MNQISRELIKAINGSGKSKTSPYDSKGTVKRIEGKTAWIQLNGGIDETPVEKTIDCRPGDIVQVRVDNGAWITGNLTAPPTDDKIAKEARTIATRAGKAAGEADKKAEAAAEAAEEAAEAAEDAQEDIDELVEAIEDGEFDIDYVAIEYCLSDSNATFVKYGDWDEEIPAYVTGKYYWTRTATHYMDGHVVYSDPIFGLTEQIAAETKIALESTNNHFWHDNSGAYVTEQNQSYATGYATRITNAGILQSYNGNLMSSWTNSGVTFYKSDGQTPLAIYGSSGISFASDVPYTIGNNSSFIKWVQENGAWKIKICADSIEMGGSEVLVDGDAGQWYSGTGITGTSATATVFPNSGVSAAKVGDMYLNTNTSNTYRCTVEGNASTARWVYVNNIKGEDGQDGQDGQDGRDGVDVTSQYMEFDITNGLRVYSGNKNSYTYNTSYTQIKTNGMTVVSGGTQVAFFGSTISLGTGGNCYAAIDSYGLSTNYVSTTYDIDCDRNLYVTKSAYVNSNVECGNKVICDDNYIRSKYGYDNPASATDPNTYITSSGNIMKVKSSSMRYKEDIDAVREEMFDPHRLYGLPVRQFRYKRGYFGEEEITPDAYNLNIGFIAEEVYEHYPAAAEFSDGQVETWSARTIIPPMLALIQEQRRDIDALTEQIARLTA